MTEDIDTTRFIEERIRDHYNARITADKSDCDYRVSPEDFQVFVKRMSAKVEHTPGQYHGRDCHFGYVTLHVADVGTTRVYSHPEVGRGAYEPCELSEPRVGAVSYACPDVPSSPVIVAGLASSAERMDRRLRDRKLEAVTVINIDFDGVFAEEVISEHLVELRQSMRPIPASATLRWPEFASMVNRVGVCVENDQFVLMTPAGKITVRADASIPKSTIRLE